MSTIPGGPLCSNCHVAPAWQGYSFCSKRCGREAKEGRNATPAAAPAAGGPNYPSRGPSYGGTGYGGYGDNDDDDDISHTASPRGYNPGNYDEDEEEVDDGMCKQCGVRPRFGGHDYCGRTCGQAAKKGVPPTKARSNTGSSSNFSQPTGGGNAGGFGSRLFSGGNGGSGSTAAPIVRCKITTCYRPEDEPGSGYCGNSHREEGVRKGIDPPCLFCAKMPRLDAKTHFCGNKCANKSMAGAPMLLEVKESDPRFADVAGQFKGAWKHTSKPPRVARVYKIILPQKSLDAYDAYKDKIESAGGFSGRGMQPGNERRRWHGTRRQCKIGDDGRNLKMCGSSSCAVCCILKTSYDVKYAATGMFGKGIYASATSSKSDTYTRGAAPGSPYKSMFLNRVVVGKGKILTAADNTLRVAPDGFHSVIANPGSGLNYDELIVYNNDAIRPSWLLLYDAVVS